MAKAVALHKPGTFWPGYIWFHNVKIQGVALYPYIRKGYKI